MEVGQKVRLISDGRVGSVTALLDDGSALVTMPTLTDHLNKPGMQIAGLEDLTVNESDLETEWLEGPDIHNRYWDQDGNQVVFGPNGDKTLVDHAVVRT